MLRFRSSWLAALVGLIVWTDRAPAVTVFSYDPSEGQLPTEQGWLGFEIDNDGPLTEPSVPGTSADNANAVIENFDGMNVLHIRDTLTDGAFDLPNYYYPWAPAEQQMLINNGVKFTMVY